MTRRAGLAVVLLALALPAGASAQDCQGPPGASAVDQYCEAIPSGGGGSRSSEPGAAGAPGALPPAAAAELGRSADGRRLLELVGDGDSGAPAPSAGVAEPPPVANDALDALGSALADPPVLVTVLAWILAALGLVMAGLAVLRLRARRAVA